MRAYREFIDEMSKSEKREIKSRLSVVIEHALKLKYVHDQMGTDNARGWNNTIERERRALADLFLEHPGLKPELTDQLVDEVYRAAVAVVQSEYRHVRFPRLRGLSIQEFVGERVMEAVKT